MNIFLRLSLSFLLFTSCQKQSPPQLDNPTTVVIDLRRADSCRQTSYTKNFLMKKNILNFFICGKWDKEFPDLFQAIVSVDKKMWDHIFSPLSKAFFENEARRDEIIHHIKNLNKIGALDDFGKVIKSMSKSNFYDGLNLFLSCSRDNNQRKCFSRKEKILKPDVMKKFLRNFKINASQINNFSFFLSRFAKSLKLDIAEIKEVYSILNNTPTFLEKKILLLNSFLGEFLYTYKKNDRLFLQNFLNTRIKNKEDGWIENFIKKKISEKDFYSLIRYPYEVNKNLVKDVKVLNKVLLNNVSCSKKAVLGGLEIDFGNYINKLISLYIENEQQKFFELSIQNLSLLQTGSAACPEIKSYRSEIEILTQNKKTIVEHELNFLNLVENLGQFSTNLNHFKFAKFLNGLVLSSKEKKIISKKDTSYFLNFLAKSFSESIINITKFSDENSSRFLPLIYKVLKEKLDKEQYNSLAIMFYEFFKKSSDEMASLSKGWDFFSYKEKTFFLKIIDEHFLGTNDFSKLFSFYSNILDTTSEGVQVVLDTYFKEKNINMTLSSMETLSANLVGEKVLKDFALFFSEKYILKIVETIAEGSKTDLNNSEELKPFLIDEYLLSLRIPSVIIDTSDLRWTHAEEAQSCINKLSSKKNNFYVLMKVFPGECKKFRESEFGVYLISSFSIFNQNYRKTFKTKREGIFGEEGVLSKSSFFSILVMLKSFDENYEGNRGIRGIVEDLKIFFSKDKKNKYENIKISLETLLILINGTDGYNPKYRNKVFRKLVNKNNFSYLGSFIEKTAEIALDYQKWIRSGKWNKFQQRYKKKELSRYKCSNYQNKDIGGVVCPNKNKIKLVALRVLRDGNVKNSSSTYTAINQFLLAISSTGGVKIPFSGENQKIERLSIKETFKMFYELSDRSKSINKEELFYLANPKADKAYFSTEKFEYNDTLMTKKPIKRRVVLTTLERVESVQREVRFDSGYLGAHYMNAVSRAKNYNSVVISKEKLFKKCVPFSFCGKTMNKLEKRMAKNAVETFPGLIDVNKRWRFGNLMVTLLNVIISSSDKGSTESSVSNRRILGVPIKIPKLQSKEQLKKHNSKIMYHLAMVGFFTNVSRLLRDRMGRNRREFKKFINSKELNHFDKNFLFKVNFKKMERHVKKIVKELIKGGRSKSNIVMDSINWIHKLNYQEIRIVEDTFYKVLLVTTFLGPNSHHVTKSSLKRLDSKYKKINHENIIRILAKIIPYYRILKSAWPKSFSFFKFTKSLNNFLNFYIDGLFKNKRNTNIYFTLLNDLYLGLSSALLDKNLETLADKHLKLTIGKKSKSKKIIRGGYSVLSLLNEIVESSGDGLRDAALLIKKTNKDQRLDFEPFRKYLDFTTKAQVCRNLDGPQCHSNDHYDELRRFIWLGIEEPNNYIISSINETLFEKYKKLIEFIDLTIPNIIIKSTN